MQSEYCTVLVSFFAKEVINLRYLSVSSASDLGILRSATLVLYLVEKIVFLVRIDVTYSHA